MKMRDWFKLDKKRRQSAFAEAVGISQSAVSRLCAGSYIPSGRVMMRIERETGGEVTANDLVAAHRAYSQTLQAAE